MPESYWAGLFDGEGCIQPYYYTSKIHNEKFIVAFRASVSQKEPMILYMLQKQYGGYVRVSPTKTISGVQTQRGQWECSRTEDVIAFLSAIKPFVVIKETEVMIALEILESVLKTKGQYAERKKGGFNGKTPITLEEIRIRQLLGKKFYEDRKSWKNVKVEVKLEDSPI
jgi:hypothetical protein